MTTPNKMMQVTGGKEPNPALRDQAGHGHGDDIENRERAFDPPRARDEDRFQQEIDAYLRPKKGCESGGGFERPEEQRGRNRDGIGQDDQRIEGFYTSYLAASKTTDTPSIRVTNATRSPINQ